MLMNFIKSIIGALLIAAGALGIYTAAGMGERAAVVIGICVLLPGIAIYLNGLVGSLERDSRRSLIEAIVTLSVAAVFLTIGAVVAIMTYSNPFTGY